MTVQKKEDTMGSTVKEDKRSEEFARGPVESEKKLLRFLYMTDLMAKEVIKTPYKAVILALLYIVSSGILYWSITYREPLIGDMLELETEKNALEASLYELKKKLPQRRLRRKRPRRRLRRRSQRRQLQRPPRRRRRRSARRPGRSPSAQTTRRAMRPASRW